MRYITLLFAILFYSNAAYSQNAYTVQHLESKIIQSQYDSSIIIANEIILADSINWRAYYYLGKSYLAQYKFFNALNAFEKANALDSANYTIEQSLAETYSYLGKNEEAINIYYDQYLRDTNRIEPIKDLADIFRKNREYASAAHYYQKAILTDSGNFYYFKQLAYCISRLSLPDYTPAILAYKKAISLNPYDINCYVQITNLYNSKKCFTQAIETCRQGLEIHPKNYDLKKALAYSYFLNKDYDSSLVYFENLLEAEDSSLMILKYTGLCYFEIMDFDSSIYFLEKACYYQHNDTEVCFFLGSAYARTGQYQKGIEILNKTISMLAPPQNFMSEIYSEIAFIYQNTGQYKKSLEYLKLAYKEDAKPILSFKMGQLYDYYLNNKKLAINCYDAYLTMANAPDTLKSSSKVLINSFTENPELIKNATERIRLLNEGLFFENTEKE